jgi:cytidine deaminase
MQETNLTPSSLAAPEQALIQVAANLITNRAKEGRHHIACALLTTDGRTFLGLHISASVGICSVCAETIAIGQSQLDGPSSISSIVSLRMNFASMNYEIVPPCGSCRERIFEFGPQARVLMGGNREVHVVCIGSLLPSPFIRRK